MHHAIADTEDPTTQISWPSRRMNDPSSVVAPRVEDRSSSQTPVQEAAAKANDTLPTKRRLSTWNLITLSISMAGAQIAWTVELGCATCLPGGSTYLSSFSYGTPFLLTLGISEQVTSLVWLAGPISGLIAQPVIGTHVWNRRITPLIRIYRCYLRLFHLQIPAQNLDRRLDSSSRLCYPHPRLL